MLRWAPLAVAAAGVVAGLREGTSFDVVFYLFLGAPCTYRLATAPPASLASVPETVDPAPELDHTRRDTNQTLTTPGL